jgi:hypothetical protein
MAEEFVNYSNRSLFNEAGFIIQRLHKIQDRINLMIRPNPLLWNQELNCYNYQVWFADLSSLLNEVWGKLSDDEQEDIEKLRQLIRTALKDLPIHKIVRDEERNTTKLIVDEKIWATIENNIDKLEKKIRVAMESHGLGNPDVEGDMF